MSRFAPKPTAPPVVIPMEAAYLALRALRAAIDAPSAIPYGHMTSDQRAGDAMDRVNLQRAYDEIKAAATPASSAHAAAMREWKLARFGAAA